MTADSGQAGARLLCDGGLTRAPALLQLQADLLGMEVVRPACPEVTALGAAVAAGATLGLWQPGARLQDAAVFGPQLGQAERERKLGRWEMAVQRSLGWELQAGTEIAEQD